MAIAPVEVAHYCPSCCVWWPGHAKAVDVLSDDYGCGFPIEEVETYTVWHCGDPAGACELDDEPLEQYNMFRCAECDQIYEQIADALECCTE